MMAALTSFRSTVSQGREFEQAGAIMAQHYPRRGEVLGCDFAGLRQPEIVKSRPVVVFSVSPARPNLAIVVPLSTTPPQPVQPWHRRLHRVWDRQERWAKCDLLYAVSYQRLFPWRLGKTAQGREYLRNFFVDEDDFTAIQEGILAALNIVAK
jgi:uncharacterized protein YifN (PemK superfamily)